MSKFHLNLSTTPSSSSSWAGFSMLFTVLLAVTIALCSLVHLSSQEGAFSSLASPRCSSICRRNEESLCKRCLFREPMRFGKRASNFREPMRFGKKSASAPVSADVAAAAALLDELAKRDLREPMRFGKKSSNSNFNAPSSLLSLHESSQEMNGNPIGKRAEFREPMRFGKRFDGAERAGKAVPSNGGGEVVGPVMSEEGTLSLEAPWIGSFITAEQPVFGSLLISGSEENNSSD